MKQNTTPYNVTQAESAALIALPKVELHVHLEGFVDLPFWQQMTRSQGSWNLERQAQMEVHFGFVDFAQFLKCFGAVIFSFLGPEDFYQLTLKALRDLHSQGVKYAEVMLSPSFFVARGIDFHETLAEIDRAAGEMEQQVGIGMQLIFDGPRNFGVQAVQENFKLATKDRTGRVVGVGLGGDEANFPARDFQAPFAWAKAQGLKLTCHAGESAPESSIADAVNLLGAQRVGHGLGITAGGPVEELILSRQIGVDLCPHSNQMTGVITDLAEHPLVQYLERGYAVSLNSDDPGFFRTSLLNEYKWAFANQKLSLEQLSKISISAVDQSFLSDTKKMDLKQKISHFQENQLS